MMQVLNYTPDAITVYVRGFEEVAAEKTITLPSSGVARLIIREKPVMLDEFHRASIPVGFGTSVPGGWMVSLLADFFTEEFVGVTGLPDPQPGMFYIVTKEVYNACPDRDDLIYPVVPIWDNEGKIIGYRGFSAPRKKKCD